MKLRLVAIAGLLSILLAAVPAASAVGPTGTWGTGIACVNLSAVAASVTLTFYSENNATAVLTYVDPTPIPAGGSRNYYTPSNNPPGLPNAFTGSAVVTSDQQIGCNVNTQTTGLGTAGDPIRVDTSKGVAAGGTPVFAPQVMKTFGGWSSYISIQNTSAAAALVTVTYKDRFGADVAGNEQFNIPANTNHVFSQETSTILPGNFLGAAMISSTAPLAGVVAMYNAGTSNLDAQFLTYNTVSNGANKILVPRIVRNYYGYNGGVSIQNVGSAATSVAITFTFAGTSYVYNNPSLAAGAALSLYAPNITQLVAVDSLPVNQRFGNAVIQAGAGGLLVAIVNEDNRGVGSTSVEQVGQGAAYNAIPDGAQTNTVSFAQITKNAGGVYSGGFNVTNTTAIATTCNITFSSVPAANQTNVSLPANGSISRYAPNVAGLPASFNGSVSVACGQPIVGISNLAAASGTGKLGDSFTQVTGTNQ
jgi:hypothetical protein